MADIVKKVELEIGLAKGGDKALKAIGKTLLDQLKKIEKEINDKQSEIENRIGQGLSVKRATGQLEKLRSEFEKVRGIVKEIDWAQEEYVRIEKSKIQLAKEKLKLEKDFTKEVEKRARIERAAQHVSEKNRLDKVFGKESFGYMAEKYGTQANLPPGYLQDALLSKFKGAKSTLPKNYLAVKSADKQAWDRIITYMRQEGDFRQTVLPENYLNDKLIAKYYRGAKTKLPKDYFDRIINEGKSTPLPPDYLQNALLEKYKGAQSRLSPDYFAEDGSKASLQRKLEQLNKLRDMKAPTSSGFKSLSAEIDATEKSLGRLTNRISGDGMASFRKFSHMIFNITGLFFIASRGFEGMIKTLTRGAEFDTMRQAFQGTAQDIENMRKASRGLLSDEKIFAFSNKATDLGIKIKDQPIFIDMAIRSMKAYGGGVEKLDEILEKVIKSTETAQKELSSLGIKKVDFQEKVQELSKALVQNNEKYELVNKSLETSKKLRKDYLLELDAEDQKMVKVQALLQLYGKSLSDVTSVQQTMPDKVLSINAQWENFTNTLAQRLLPVATTVFPVITGFFEFVTSNAGRLVGALTTISVALGGLTAFFFMHGNPLSGVVAGISAILIAIAAFKTAFPDLETQLSGSNSRLITLVKDLRGEYEALGAVVNEAGGVANAQQQALIDKTETLISKNRERIDQESQLSKILTEARVKELQAENKILEAKTRLLEDGRDKKPVTNLSQYKEDYDQLNRLETLNLEYLALTGSVDDYNSKIAETKEKYAQNKSAIEDYYKSLDQRSLLSVIVRDFGNLGKGIQGFTEHLLNGTASVNTLKNALIGLGQKGVAAMYGISAAALKNATSLKFLLQAIGLQVSAAELYKTGNPLDIKVADSYVSISNKLIEGIRSNFPTKEEQLPGNTNGTGNRGGKDKGKDLDTFSEKLRMISDQYKTWEERQAAVNRLVDDVGQLAEQKVGANTTLDYIAKITNPVKGELKPTDAIQKILKLYNSELDDIKRNTKEVLTDEQMQERTANARMQTFNLINDILDKQKNKVKDISQTEIEQIETLKKGKVAIGKYVFRIWGGKIFMPNPNASDYTQQLEESLPKIQEAAQKVAQSMRDFTKDWNPGIKGLMTYFEMAEIAVRSLADTLTSELGTAWENVFGEANSLFEKFVKNVITKIAELLIVRGIAKLLTFLFPGVGEILGAGLTSSAGGGFGGGGDALGRGITNTYLSSRVDSRPINIYLTGTLEGQTFLKSTMPQYENYKQAIKVV